MKNTHSKHSIKIENRVFAKTSFAAIVLMLGLALTACGQRGALYLPTAPEAAQRSSIVDTLTTPTKTEAEAQKK